MKTWLLAACAIFAAIGSAQAADQCVWVHNIDNFRSAQDEKSVIISDSPSRKYTVTFQGRCLGLRFTETIAVRSVGNMFCLTPGDVVSFSDNGARQRCMISKIEPVAPPASDSGDHASDNHSDQPTGY